ncbi:MAG: hypothetical protein PWP68_968 [Rikenellaceae bacterium]|nr:hypothetical protein [Rikenellaceae bacterium]
MNKAAADNIMYKTFGIMQKSIELHNRIMILYIKSVQRI